MRLLVLTLVGISASGCLSIVSESPTEKACRHFTGDRAISRPGGTAEAPGALTVEKRFDLTGEQDPFLGVELLTPGYNSEYLFVFTPGATVQIDGETVPLPAPECEGAAEGFRLKLATLTERRLTLSRPQATGMSIVVVEEFGSRVIEGGGAGDGYSGGDGD